MLAMKACQALPACVNAHADDAGCAQGALSASRGRGQRHLDAGPKELDMWHDGSCACVGPPQLPDKADCFSSAIPLLSAAQAVDATEICEQ